MKQEREKGKVKDTKRLSRRWGSEEIRENCPGPTAQQTSKQYIAKKISPVRDWRSTPTYCQLQSHVTQN